MHDTAAGNIPDRKLNQQGPCYEKAQILVIKKKNRSHE